MGGSAFMIIALLSGLVYGIFSKDLEVGSIGDETYLASLIDQVPMTVEEEKQPQKKDDGGGGGGGGREEEETTLGDLANQTQNPQRAPQAIPRLENPSLVLPPASTQGNRTFEQKYDRYGDPNGRFTSWNNGPGSGGGQEPAREPVKAADAAPEQARVTAQAAAAALVMRTAMERVQEVVDRHLRPRVRWA